MIKLDSFHFYQRKLPSFLLSDVDFHFRQLLFAGTASASVAPRPRRYRDLRTRAVPAGGNCLSFQSTYRYFDNFK